MSTKFNCPHCGEEIDIDTVLQADIDVQVSKSIAEKEAALSAEMDNRFYEREQKLKEDQAKREHELVSKAVEAEINRQKEERERLIAEQEKQATENSRLTELLSSQKDEIAAREHDLLVKEKNLEIENTRKLEEEKKRVEEETRKRIEDENTLKNADNAVQMDSLRREIDTYRRKLEATSQQLIGEGQEIALEAALRMAFPTDLIEPVEKGMKGADCIQRVRANGSTVGTIVWESKRTKQWLNEWVPKLKDDQRTLNAELAILVTQTLPNGFPTKAGLNDGVWVTDFPTAISVATALRYGLIEASMMKALSSGSDEKSQKLFDYITSQEFRGNMSAIIETFIAFEADLAAEKRAMEKQWKKRQTTIARALTASNRIYGSLQGTLGEKALPDIEQEAPKQLEA